LVWELQDSIIMLTRFLCTALAAAVLCFVPSGLKAQGEHAGSPGETVPGRPLLTLDEASSTCIDLPWGAELGTISDTKLSELCVVTELGQLETTGERAWWWAIYRRESVWGAESDTPEQDLDLLPDTIAVDELVLFAGSPEGGRVRAVWHDRVERRYQRIRPPRSDGDLLVHRHCLNGTGGCLDGLRYLGEGSSAAIGRIRGHFLRGVSRRGLLYQWHTPLPWGAL
jgi:hypothetical protein